MILYIFPIIRVARTTMKYDLFQDFHLNVSLFERMILNGFPFVSLEEQHRMGPPIAAVVSRVFYPQLRNHPFVERYPEIRCVKKDNERLRESHILQPETAITNLLI